jgi:hypothetical protein
MLCGYKTMMLILDDLRRLLTPVRVLVTVTTSSAPPPSTPIPCR